MRASRLNFLVKITVILAVIATLSLGGYKLAGDLIEKLASLM